MILPDKSVTVRAFQAARSHKGVDQATMTEASSILLDSISRNPSSYDSDLIEATADIAETEDSGPRYAPANWLDAFIVDERSRSDEAFGERVPVPSDEAGLYPRFMRLVD
ncbi:MAG: hypothetical protein KJ755_07790 [Alphaproteobacteria bacterium]|nr:hypothetical protein [Alphaproteobacteria bacterium]